MKVEVELLDKVATSWVSDVAPKLKEAAGSIEELKYTVVQFGALFWGAWESYTKAAQYIQDRLNEAGPAAEKMGTALHHAAVSFGAQESENEQNIARIAAQMNPTVQ
ncbi:hypothetical protein [Nocardia cyriacigeorgica]|uniref:hypothetical protein n=1 Tax=Nocardia cyriacigeorgica TaxID=135487 RepID=UPI0024541F96|nr:hypothetical protein [Nocardia cyriacigeorgica]